MVVSANIYTCEPKTDGICGRSIEEVLATGFFSGKGHWGLLYSRSLEIVVTPTAWLLLVTLFLFPVMSVYPTVAGLWVG